MWQHLTVYIINSQILFSANTIKSMLKKIKVILNVYVSTSSVNNCKIFIQFMSFSETLYIQLQPWRQYFGPSLDFVYRYDLWTQKRNTIFNLTKFKRVAEVIKPHNLMKLGSTMKCQNWMETYPSSQPPPKIKTF